MSVLELREVSKRLGRVQVVDDVSLDCDAGQITILTGHNGAGKSTLLSLVAGVMRPDRGVIAIHGQPPGQGRDRTRTRRRLGYVPEAANPPGHMTPHELFGLVQRLERSQPLDDHIAQALDVHRVADRRIERLSLGERRRVCLAAALIGAPALLVLDEPTNGLDADGMETLVAQLAQARERDTAILIATHDRAFADRLADQRAHMEAGRLRQTSPAPGPRTRPDAAPDPG